MTTISRRQLLQIMATSTGVSVLPQGLFAEEITPEEAHAAYQKWDRENPVSMETYGFHVLNGHLKTVTASPVHRRARAQAMIKLHGVLAESKKKEWTPRETADRFNEMLKDGYNPDNPNQFIPLTKEAINPYYRIFVGELPEAIRKQDSNLGVLVGGSGAIAGIWAPAAMSTPIGVAAFALGTLIAASNPNRDRIKPYNYIDNSPEKALDNFETAIGFHTQYLMEYDDEFLKTLREHPDLPETLKKYAIDLVPSREEIAQKMPKAGQAVLKIVNEHAVKTDDGDGYKVQASQEDTQEIKDAIEKSSKEIKRFIQKALDDYTKQVKKNAQKNAELRKKENEKLQRHKLHEDIGHFVSISRNIASVFFPNDRDFQRVIGTVDIVNRAVSVLSNPQITTMATINVYVGAAVALHSLFSSNKNRPDPAVEMMKELHKALYDFRASFEEFRMEVHDRFDELGRRQIEILDQLLEMREDILSDIEQTRSDIISQLKAFQTEVGAYQETNQQSRRETAIQKMDTALEEIVSTFRDEGDPDELVENPSKDDIYRHVRRQLLTITQHGTKTSKHIDFTNDILGHLKSVSFSDLATTLNRKIRLDHKIGTLPLIAREFNVSANMIEDMPNPIEWARAVEAYLTARMLFPDLDSDAANQYAKELWRTGVEMIQAIDEITSEANIKRITNRYLELSKQEVAKVVRAVNEAEQKHGITLFALDDYLPFAHVDTLRHKGFIGSAPTNSFLFDDLAPDVGKGYWTFGEKPKGNALLYYNVTSTQRNPLLEAMRLGILEVDPNREDTKWESDSRLVKRFDVKKVGLAQDYFSDNAYTRTFPVIPSLSPNLTLTGYPLNTYRNIVENKMGIRPSSQEPLKTPIIDKFSPLLKEIAENRARAEWKHYGARLYNDPFLYNGMIRDLEKQVALPANTMKPWDGFKDNWAKYGVNHSGYFLHETGYPEIRLTGEKFVPGNLRGKPLASYQHYSGYNRDVVMSRRVGEIQSIHTDTVDLMLNDFRMPRLESEPSENDGNVEHSLEVLRGTEQLIANYHDHAVQDCLATLHDQYGVKAEGDDIDGKGISQEFKAVAASLRYVLALSAWRSGDDLNLVSVFESNSDILLGNSGAFIKEVEGVIGDIGKDRTKERAQDTFMKEELALEYANETPMYIFEQQARANLGFTDQQSLTKEEEALVRADTEQLSIHKKAKVNSSAKIHDKISIPEAERAKLLAENIVDIEAYMQDAAITTYTTRHVTKFYSSQTGQVIPHLSERIADGLTQMFEETVSFSKMNEDRSREGRCIIDDALEALDTFSTVYNVKLR